MPNTHSVFGQVPIRPYNVHIARIKPASGRRLEEWRSRKGCKQMQRSMRTPPQVRNCLRGIFVVQ